MSLDRISRTTGKEEQPRESSEFFARIVDIFSFFKESREISTIPDSKSPHEHNQDLLVCNEKSAEDETNKNRNVKCITTVKSHKQKTNSKNRRLQKNTNSKEINDINNQIRQQISPNSAKKTDAEDGIYQQENLKNEIPCPDISSTFHLEKNKRKKHHSKCSKEQKYNQTTGSSNYKNNFIDTKEKEPGKNMCVLSNIKQEETKGLVKSVYHCLSNDRLKKHKKYHGAHKRCHKKHRTKRSSMTLIEDINKIKNATLDIVLTNSERKLQEFSINKSESVVLKSHVHLDRRKPTVHKDLEEEHKYLGITLSQGNTRTSSVVTVFTNDNILKTEESYDRPKSIVETGLQIQKQTLESISNKGTTNKTVNPDMELKHNEPNANNENICTGIDDVEDFEGKTRMKIQSNIERKLLCEKTCSQTDFEDKFNYCYKSQIVNKKLKDNTTEHKVPESYFVIGNTVTEEAGIYIKPCFLIKSDTMLGDDSNSLMVKCSGNFPVNEQILHNLDLKQLKMHSNNLTDEIEILDTASDIMDKVAQSREKIIADMKLIHYTTPEIEKPIFDEYNCCNMTEREQCINSTFKVNESVDIEVKVRDGESLHNMYEANDVISVVSKNTALAVGYNKRTNSIKEDIILTGNLSSEDQIHKSEIGATQLKEFNSNLSVMCISHDVQGTDKKKQEAVSSFNEENTSHKRGEVLQRLFFIKTSELTSDETNEQQDKTEGFVEQAPPNATVVVDEKKLSSAVDNKECRLLFCSRRTSYGNGVCEHKKDLHLIDSKHEIVDENCEFFKRESKLNIHKKSKRSKRNKMLKESTVNSELNNIKSKQEITEMSLDRLNRTADQEDQSRESSEFFTRIADIFSFFKKSRGSFTIPVSDSMQEDSSFQVLLKCNTNHDLSVHNKKSVELETNNKSRNAKYTAKIKSQTWKRSSKSRRLQKNTNSKEIYDINNQVRQQISSNNSKKINAEDAIYQQENLKIEVPCSDISSTFHLEKNKRKKHHSKCSKEQKYDQTIGFSNYKNNFIDTKEKEPGKNMCVLSNKKQEETKGLVKSVYHCLSNDRLKKHKKYHGAHKRCHKKHRTKSSSMTHIEDINKIKNATLDNMVVNNERKLQALCNKKLESVDLKKHMHLDRRKPTIPKDLQKVKLKKTCCSKTQDRDADLKPAQTSISKIFNERKHDSLKAKGCKYDFSKKAGKFEFKVNKSMTNEKKEERTTLKYVYESEITSEAKINFVKEDENISTLTKIPMTEVNVKKNKAPRKIRPTTRGKEKRKVSGKGDIKTTKRVEYLIKPKIVVVETTGPNTVVLSENSDFSALTNSLNPTQIKKHDVGRLFTSKVDAGQIKTINENGNKISDSSHLSETISSKVRISENEKEVSHDALSYELENNKEDFETGELKENLDLEQESIFVNARYSHIMEEQLNECTILHHKTIHKTNMHSEVEELHIEIGTKSLHKVNHVEQSQTPISNFSFQKDRSSTLEITDKDDIIVLESTVENEPQISPQKKLNEFHKSFEYIAGRNENAGFECKANDTDFEVNDFCQSIEHAYNKQKNASIEQTDTRNVSKELEEFKNIACKPETPEVCIFNGHVNEQQGNTNIDYAYTQNSSKEIDEMKEILRDSVDSVMTILDDSIEHRCENGNVEFEEKESIFKGKGDVKDISSKSFPSILEKTFDSHKDNEKGDPCKVLKPFEPVDNVVVVNLLVEDHPTKRENNIETHNVSPNSVKNFQISKNNNFMKNTIQNSDESEKTTTKSSSQAINKGTMKSKKWHCLNEKVSISSKSNYTSNNKNKKLPNHEVRNDNRKVLHPNKTNNPYSTAVKSSTGPFKSHIEMQSGQRKNMISRNMANRKNKNNMQNVNTPESCVEHKSVRDVSTVCIKVCEPKIREVNEGTKPEIKSVNIMTQINKPKIEEKRKLNFNKNGTNNQERKVLKPLLKKTWCSKTQDTGADLKPAQTSISKIVNEKKHESLLKPVKNIISKIVNEKIPDSFKAKESKYGFSKNAGKYESKVNKSMTNEKKEEKTTSKYVHESEIAPQTKIIFVKENENISTLTKISVPEVNEKKNKTPLKIQSTTWAKEKRKVIGKGDIRKTRNVENVTKPKTVVVEITGSNTVVDISSENSDISALTDSLNPTQIKKLDVGRSFTYKVPAEPIKTINQKRNNISDSSNLAETTSSEVKIPENEKEVSHDVLSYELEKNKEDFKTEKLKENLNQERESISVKAKYSHIVKEQMNEHTILLDQTIYKTNLHSEGEELHIEIGTKSLHKVNHVEKSQTPISVLSVKKDSSCTSEITDRGGIMELESSVENESEISLNTENIHFEQIDTECTCKLKTARKSVCPSVDKLDKSCTCCKCEEIVHEEACAVVPPVIDQTIPQNYVTHLKATHDVEDITLHEGTGKQALEVGWEVLNTDVGTGAQYVEPPRYSIEDLTLHENPKDILQGDSKSPGSNKIKPTTSRESPQDNRESVEHITSSPLDISSSESSSTEAEYGCTCSPKSSLDEVEGEDFSVYSRSEEPSVHSSEVPSGIGSPEWTNRTEYSDKPSHVSSSERINQEEHSITSSDISSPGPVIIAGYSHFPSFQISNQAKHKFSTSAVRKYGTEEDEGNINLISQEKNKSRADKMMHIHTLQVPYSRDKIWNNDGNNFIAKSLLERPIEYEEKPFNVGLSPILLNEDVCFNFNQAQNVLTKGNIRKYFEALDFQKYGEYEVNDYSLASDVQNTPTKNQICLFNNNYFVFTGMTDQIRQNVQETEEKPAQNTPLNPSVADGCGLEIYKLTPEGFAFVESENIKPNEETGRNVISTTSSETKISLIPTYNHDTTPDSEIEMSSVISEEAFSETAATEMVSNYKKEINSVPESAESEVESGEEDEVISKRAAPKMLSDYSNEKNSVLTEAESIKAKDVEKVEVSEPLAMSQIHEPTQGWLSVINGQCALMTNDGNIKVIPENIMNLMEKFIIASNGRVMDDPNEVYEHVKNIIFTDLVNNKIVGDESTSVNSSDLSFLLRPHSDVEVNPPEVLHDVSQTQSLRKPQPAERKKGDEDGIQEDSFEELSLEEHELIQEEAGQAEMKDSVTSDDWTNDNNQWEYVDKQDKENLPLQNLYETENETTDEEDGQIEERESLQLEDESADELLNSDDELKAYVEDKTRHEMSSEESLNEASFQEEYLEDDKLSDKEELSDESISENIKQEDPRGKLLEKESVLPEIKAEGIEETYSQLTAEERLEMLETFGTGEDVHEIDRKGAENTFNFDKEEVNVLERISHEIDKNNKYPNFSQSEHLERNKQPDLESPQISDSVLLRKQSTAQTSLLKAVREPEPNYDVKEVKESKPKSKWKSFSKIKQLFSKKKQEKVLSIVEKENVGDINVIMTPNAYEDRPSFAGLLPGRLIENDPLFSKQQAKVKFFGQSSNIKEEGSVPTQVSSEKPDWPSGTPKNLIESIQGDVNITVQPADIANNLRRGFRSDGLALSGDRCFLANPERYSMSQSDSTLSFSEREPPLDFLLGLGFNVDDATTFVKDIELNGRLRAAITEAKIWVNKISKSQGMLLVRLAFKARPKIMRYYLLMVESIVNKRITDAVKLDGFLHILEKVEDGHIPLVSIFGSDKIHEDYDEEKIKREERNKFFAVVYKMALNESMKIGFKRLSKTAVNLLYFLTDNYKPRLHPHLELLSEYIGQNRITTQVQLEAAMIFLIRLDSEEVKFEEFEKFCDIKRTSNEDISNNFNQDDNLNHW